MSYSIKKREELKKVEEEVSLQNQVKAVRLQEKLGKQNLHEELKKVFEPVTDTMETTSENLTETITDTSKENNKAKENLNTNILEIMNDRGILAIYLLSLLS